MKTALDCIPCLIRQAIDAARRSSPEPDFHIRVTREILQWASVINLQDSPPALAQQIHRRLREATAAADPYGPLKTFHNQLAWRLLPQLEAAVSEARDPLAMATRLAIAGNVIDAVIADHVGRPEGTHILMRPPSLGERASATPGEDSAL